MSRKSQKSQAEVLVAGIIAQRLLWIGKRISNDCAPRISESDRVDFDPLVLPDSHTRHRKNLWIYVTIKTAISKENQSVIRDGSFYPKARRRAHFLKAN